MKYFTLKELARSDVATRLGIDNTPTEEAIRNLHHLVDNVLDPLREAYGHPIYVNSGYRCPALNRAVGGARNSQHLRGQAADIKGSLPQPPPKGEGSQRTDGPSSALVTPPLGETEGAPEVTKLGQLIIDLGLPFDQLIFYPSFLHVSWSLTPRHQVLYS